MVIAKAHLISLRNEIPIDDIIIKVLNMEHRFREGHLRFLCPICMDLHTSTQKNTNLARCFRCQKNFNPIDMLMIVQGKSFQEAVSYLEMLLPFYQSQS